MVTQINRMTRNEKAAVTIAAILREYLPSYAPCVVTSPQKVRSDD